jgi:hypothetical protein
VVFCTLLLSGITLILGAKFWEFMQHCSLTVAVITGAVIVLFSLAAVSGLPSGVGVIALVVAVATAGAVIINLFTASERCESQNPAALSVDSGSTDAKVTEEGNEKEDPQSDS